MRFRHVPAALLGVWIGLAPLGVAAETDRNAFEQARDIAADVLVARPLNLVQLVASAAFLPFGYGTELVTREDLDVLDTCIEGPAAQVFTRPLGEL